MLIDARHPEEVRVVVLRGNRVEDFDFESAEKRQLKGNIYLAKVTRVEPSLQAAFVEYGGNRHGFLAFSEIHPDYYQIPIADRERLLKEEAEELAAVEAQDASDAEAAPEADDAVPQDAAASDGDAANEEQEEDEDDESQDSVQATIVGGSAEDDQDEISAQDQRRRRRARRRYKIQEVIKRRQIMLVQVVKEERGTKGAALTTYLSLAGRYCVLMPNATHGGGISRKIASAADRRRLKSIMSDLSVPDDMGCIIRTAGMQRTKAEIKRDFDYLLRLWDDIRELTLKSVAPTLIYEEGDLIKRSIRDLYTREIDEVLVEGEEGYKNAKNFMRMLMPSHARRVQLYKDRVPLLQRYKVESQLDTMFQPVVQLKSGGYIVINPTEALVAIDVNSGKATREHNIEETAVKTNCEAAEEIARQLRLRDMAGLIVIDFIDMENRGNMRTVERRLREALKTDRARVQVGRISGFGLLEMSRQRLRPGMLEASTHSCPVCRGAGMVRSVSSSALHAIRVLEEEGLRGRASHVTITLASDVAIYVLNHKRETLRELETQYGLRIEVLADPDIIAPDYELSYAGTPPQRAEAAEADAATLDAAAQAEEEDGASIAAEDDAPASAGEEDKGKKRRRRRRRRKDDGQGARAADTADQGAAAPPGEAQAASGDTGDDGEDAPR
ncbi:MAG: ribonuclease E/G, partial [Alphaproteobacteria bacterium]